MVGTGLWESRPPLRTTIRDRRLCRLRRARRQRQPDDHDRYVVETAALQRQIEHHLTSSLGVAASGVFENLVVTQVLGQAIAANHKDIAGLGRPGDNLEFEFLGDADRPGYH